jgi:hypothetical protein
LAGLIDARVKATAKSGVDDLAIFTDMADYLPSFKHLMDTSMHDDMDQLAARYTDSINMQKSLKLWQPAFDQEKLWSQSRAHRATLRGKSDLASNDAYDSK